MLKKTLLSAFLMLSLVFSTREADLTSINSLPEIVVVGQSIERELFTALVSKHDSVEVLNGCEKTWTTVEALDSTLAKIVLAQAYLESGAFTSELAMVHYSVFGMTHPGRGKLTTSLGPRARAEGRNGYASYTSFEASALDLVLLLDFYKISHKATTPDRYVRLIKSHGYFESNEKAYATNLKKHLAHVNNLFQKSL